MKPRALRMRRDAISPLSMQNSKKERAVTKHRTWTASQVFDDLRERIAGHEIPPGFKLRELPLAAEYGISRPRLREVLAGLELRGLIDRIPNQGAIVSRLELTQVFEIYDVREALEGLCVRLATQNVPPKSWQDLLEKFDGPVTESVGRGDIAAYEREYNLVRKRIIGAANNPVLAEMLDSIYEKTRMIMRRVLILPGRAERGLRENRAVLAAMRRGDAVEAEQLKRKNIRSAIDYLKRYQDFVL